VSGGGPGEIKKQEEIMKQIYRDETLKNEIILKADSCAFSTKSDGIYVICWPIIVSAEKKWEKQTGEKKEILDFDKGIKEMIDLGKLRNAHAGRRWYPVNIFASPEEENGDWETPNEYISQWGNILAELDEDKYFIHPYNYCSDSDNGNLYPALIANKPGWFTEGKFLDFGEGISWLRDNGYWESLF
jgi:hypothetical protein